MIDVVRKQRRIGEQSRIDGGGVRSLHALLNQCGPHLFRMRAAIRDIFFTAAGRELRQQKRLSTEWKAWGATFKKNGLRLGVDSAGGGERCSGRRRRGA
jgi:hypothetical protein